MDFAPVFAFSISGAVNVDVVGAFCEASSAIREDLSKRAFGGLGLLILRVIRALSSLKVRNGRKGDSDSLGWQNRESKEKGLDMSVGPCLDKMAFNFQELLLCFCFCYI